MFQLFTLAQIKQKQGVGIQKGGKMSEKHRRIAEWGDLAGMQGLQKVRRKYDNIQPKPNFYNLILFVRHRAKAFDVALYLSYRSGKHLKHH